MRLDDIREPDGKLPAYAWPGGYPILYYTENCLEICADCANEEDTSDPVCSYGVYWEGPTIQCEDCGKDMESAYGDPDEVDNGI